MPYEDKTDEELLDAYFKGNDVAFAILKARYFEQTCRIAARINVNGLNDPEDIVMKALSAITKQCGYPSSERRNCSNAGSFRALLFVIVANKARDSNRRNGAQCRKGQGADVSMNAPRDDSEEDFSELFQDAAPSVERVVLDKIEFDKFCANRLTEQEQQIINALHSTLVDTALDKGEAAKQAGVSPANVSKFLNRFQLMWTAYRKEQKG